MKCRVVKIGNKERGYKGPKILVSKGPINMAEKLTLSEYDGLPELIKAVMRVRWKILEVLFLPTFFFSVQN